MKEDRLEKLEVVHNRVIRDFSNNNAAISRYNNNN